MSSYPYLFPLLGALCFSQTLAAPGQRVKACEYLDERSISQAIGGKVSKPAHAGDTQQFEGFVLHMCDWAVTGTERGKVILTLRETSSESLIAQGLKEAKRPPTAQPGLRVERLANLGDFAEYAYWESEPRAGVTITRGSKTVNITVMDAARFGPNHRQAFVSMAQAVFAKF